MNTNRTTGADRPGFVRTGCLFLAGLALLVLLVPALVAFAMLVLPALGVLGLGAVIMVLIFMVGLPVAVAGTAAMFAILLMGALFTGSTAVVGAVLKLAVFVIAPIVLVGYFVRRLIAA